MKPWLPHLIYCCLLLGGGFFLWRAVYRADERIAFLSQPAQETYALIAAKNQALLSEINRTRKEYPTPTYENLWRRAQQADSLVALASQSVPDSLLVQLYRLTNNEPQVNAILIDLLSKDQIRGSGRYHAAWQQNDSIRRQLALTIALNYLHNSMGSTSCSWVAYEIGFSSTSIYPIANQPFTADLALTGYAFSQAVSIRIDKQLVPIQEGVANYNRIFSAPGIYPILVEAEYLGPKRDSLLTCTKTFFLHVKP